MLGSKIKDAIRESVIVKEKMIEYCLEDINSAGNLLVDSLSKNGKVLICGNGGSAADAQHMAAELVVRFRVNREAIAGIALTTDTSILTACSNDFAYEDIFSRQVEALGQKGDVLVAISTSGNSANVIEAINTARERGMHVIGLTGSRKSKMPDLCDVCIAIPSQDTARIQEGHILCIHILCGIVEQGLTGEEK